jgi:hypothetical protein
MLWCIYQSAFTVWDLEAAKFVLLVGALMRSYPIGVSVAEPPPICNKNISQYTNLCNPKLGSNSQYGAMV